MAPKLAPKKASLASVKHFVLSPLSLAIGALLAAFLIFLTIGMGLLYNLERQQYEKDRAVVQLLRDFIIGDNEKLEKESDEVIFSLVQNRTAALLEIKETIRQVRNEAKTMRELTSGTVGHGHSFYQTLFYIPKKTATFDQAVEECAKIGATLVTVKTREEQRFINDVVHRQLANEHWLGLFRSAATTYKWTWLDKSVTYAVDYWNTPSNQPKHPHFVEGGPNCVANQKKCEDKELGVWNRCWEERKCSEIYHFICRISKNERWI